MKVWVVQARGYADPYVYMEERKDDALEMIKWYEVLNSDYADYCEFDDGRWYSIDDGGSAKLVEVRE